MTDVLLVREVVAVLLAGLLLVAGGAKLLDIAGTQRSAGELGVSPFLGRLAAVFIPPLELALGAGLLFAASSRAAAAAAACLFAVFAVLIGLNAARGRRPDCGCFGPLRVAGAGYAAVARNGVLAGLAMVVSVMPATPIGWAASVAAAGAAVLLGQAALSVALLRRYGRALARIDELHAEARAAGAVPRVRDAPGFELTDVAGSRVAASDLLGPGAPVLLVFADARCGPCRALIPALATLQRASAGSLTIAVVGQGDAGSLQSLAEPGHLPLLLADDGSVAALYGVEATPSAVLIERDGTIAAPTVTGAHEIMRLAESRRPTAPRAEAGGRPGRIAAPALAATLASAARASAAPAEPAAAGDPRLVSLLQAFHVQLGKVTLNLGRALAALEPPAQEPAGATAPAVAHIAAAGRSLVDGALTRVRGEPASGARTEALRYLSSLLAGFASFERAGLARDLTASARHARDGAAGFGAAARRFATLDRALGCPFGCIARKAAP